MANKCKVRRAVGERAGESIRAYWQQHIAYSEMGTAYIIIIIIIII